ALRFHQGTIHDLKGELSQALEHYKRSLALREQLGDKYEIAMSLNAVGLIHRQKGELEQALPYFQQSLTFSKQLGNKNTMAISLGNIGLLHMVKGDLNQALEYCQESLTYFKEIGVKASIAAVLNNMGVLYMWKGDLDLALESYEQSLAIVEELGNQDRIAGTLGNIGEIHYQKSNLAQALAHFEQALSRKIESGNNLEMAGILLQMVSVTVAMGSQWQAEQYLQQLQQISVQEVNKVISQQHRAANALVLKMSPQARKRVKAEELLKEIIEEEVVDHELTVLALLNLCDLLLGELRMSSDPEMLAELENLVNRLLEIANESASHWLFAEAYVLKSNLALLNLDTRSARRFLTEAQVIAEEKGLQRLAMKISNDHDALLRQESQWESENVRDSSLKERLKLTHLEGLVDNLVHKRAVDVPEPSTEEPVMTLIVTKGGLTIFSKTFVPEAQINEQLIGGFLTAISSFGSEVFGGERIDRIMYQEHILTMKPLESMMFVYVFKGQSYSALQKLDRFMEIVQNSSQVWNNLARTLQTGKTLSSSEEMELAGLTIEIFQAPASAS
ncbi:MAG: tetratricopeptide repeat protein, partial [Candidatus Hodarchaeota archaeon]